ncbi:hypothetical protein DN062_10700 [Nitrincola tibetensis]|uniref:Uncharacterized protein n=1 Tax=Nitrincola tibetensis TaxID=2219697 RepID=A0A364NL62_9GAMM|nr:hypothetical protein [Nitrincola tibetensis]RAU17833.1 hypothetical protein DN062_10700 [Nitrincola tibetensis]
MILMMAADGGCPHRGRAGRYRLADHQPSEPAGNGDPGVFLLAAVRLLSGFHGYVRTPVKLPTGEGLRRTLSDSSAAGG